MLSFQASTRQVALAAAALANYPEGGGLVWHGELWAQYISAQDILHTALTVSHTLVCVCRYWDTRPTAVITRIVQLMSIAGSFISGLVMDLAQGEAAGPAWACEFQEAGPGADCEQTGPGSGASSWPSSTVMEAKGQLDSHCCRCTCLQAS